MRLLPASICAQCASSGRNHYVVDYTLSALLVVFLFLNNRPLDRRLVGSCFCVSAVGRCNHARVITVLAQNRNCVASTPPVGVETRQPCNCDESFTNETIVHPAYPMSYWSDAGGYAKPFTKLIVFSRAVSRRSSKSCYEKLDQSVLFAQAVIDRAEFNAREMQTSTPQQALVLARPKYSTEHASSNGANFAASV